MPEVSVWVELRVVVEPEVDPLVLEHAVAAEGRRAARELFSAAAAALERQILGRAGARQRQELRWVATTFGRIRCSRYRVKEGERSFHPLDRVMGWSGAEPSAGLRELVCELATRLPYRQGPSPSRWCMSPPLHP